MGAIFVAYGNRDRRFEVLEFAAEQASASGYDLVVFHLLETPGESADEVREEIESVVDGIDPYLVYDLEIERLDGPTVGTNRPKQERLLEAIFETDREFDYVVMGEVKRGPIEEIRHSSMTGAVLNERALPVTLVPI